MLPVLPAIDVYGCSRKNLNLARTSTIIKGLLLGTRDKKIKDFFHQDTTKYIMNYWQCLLNTIEHHSSLTVFIEHF